MSHSSSDLNSSRDSPNPLPAENPSSTTAMPSAPDPRSANAQSAGKQSPTSSTNKPPSSPNGETSAKAGSATATADWMHMAHPETLSVSERVVHHNMAVLAQRIDTLTDAINSYCESAEDEDQDEDDDDDNEDNHDEDEDEDKDNDEEDNNKKDAAAARPSKNRKL